MPPPITRRNFCKAQLAATAALLTGAPFVRGSDPRTPKSRPNILFVMADAWRRQSMGYAGQDPVLTPNFDRFASDALVFNQSCATRPICSPSRSCLLTSLYPQHHGLYTNGLTAPLDPQLPTFGSWLKAAGYRTSYVGKLHTGGEPEQSGVIVPSLRDTWDNWALAVGHQPFQQPYYLGRDPKATCHDGWAPDFEANQTIEFMRANKNQPFAAVLSWGPPHDGWGKGFEKAWQPGHREQGKIKYGIGAAAPASYEARYVPFDKLPRRPNVRPVPAEKGESDPTDFMQPGYYGACTALDTAFGRIVEALRQLDLYDNTLIVFTSDHGEMLGSQGRVQKGIYFEEAVGVPLLMRLGNQLPVRRVNNLASTIDLVPTMLGIVGAPLPANVDGTDLSTFARGKRDRTVDALHLSFDAGGANARRDDPPNQQRAWRTIRTERYSYSLLDAKNARSLPHKDRRVLYDLSTDPYQMQPIFGGRHQPIIDDLHARLVAHLDAVGDNFMSTKFVW